MATFYPAGGGTYNLGSSIGSTDTTILLSSFTDPATGVAITMATMNTSIAYGTIGPKTSSSEFISFTGITQNADGTATLTGVTRGLNKQYPFTTNSAYKFPHSGQTIFILSDAPQVFQKFASVDNDITINGLWTFVQTPVGLNPGAVQDASTTVKGIGKLSVAPVSATNPIFVGDNDNRVSPVSLASLVAGQVSALAGDSGSPGASNLYVTQAGYQKGTEIYGADSVGTDDYTINPSPTVTSYSAGMVFRFKAGTANTGGATLAVGSGAAKAIVKNFNTALATGDILQNQVVEVAYNSTNDNWQMISPVGTPPAQSYVGAVTASGDLSGSTQTVDTTFTCNFQASVITLYYILAANNGGVASTESGIANFPKTGTPSKFMLQSGGNGSAAFTQSTVSSSTTAILLGTASGNSNTVAVSIFAAGATSFTVRVVATKFGSGGAIANCTYYPVAFA